MTIRQVAPHPTILGAQVVWRPLDISTWRAATAMGRRWAFHGADDDIVRIREWAGPSDVVVHFDSGYVDVVRADQLHLVPAVLA